MSKVITVRTVTQAALFNFELKGQLSDGYWENARPHNHYKPWCEASVEVGTRVGRNFYADKVNYNFAAPSLVSVVGHRMIGIARVARNIDLATAELLHDAYVIECDGTVNWTVTETGPYWDTKREKLALLDHARIDAALADTSYGLKELRKDLRELGAIVKVDNRVS